MSRSLNNRLKIKTPTRQSSLLASPIFRHRWFNQRNILLLLCLFRLLILTLHHTIPSRQSPPNLFPTHTYLHMRLRPLLSRTLRTLLQLHRLLLPLPLPKLLLNTQPQLLAPTLIQSLPNLLHPPTLPPQLSLIFTTNTDRLFHVVHLTPSRLGKRVSIQFVKKEQCGFWFLTTRRRRWAGCWRCGSGIFLSILLVLILQCGGLLCMLCTCFRFTSSLRCMLAIHQP